MTSSETFLTVVYVKEVTSSGVPVKLVQTQTSSTPTSDNTIGIVSIIIELLKF